MGCLAAAAAFTISSTQLISHFAFGIWALLDVLRCHLAEDTERILGGYWEDTGDSRGNWAHSGIFRAAWHFYVLSRLHILWPQQSVRCCSV